MKIRITLNVDRRTKSDSPELSDLIMGVDIVIDNDGTYEVVREKPRYKRGRRIGSSSIWPYMDFAGNKVPIWRPTNAQLATLARWRFGVDLPPGIKHGPNGELGRWAFAELTTSRLKEIAAI